MEHGKAFKRNKKQDKDEVLQKGKDSTERGFGFCFFFVKKVILSFPSPVGMFWKIELDLQSLVVK
jgi:hypothetical protein